MIKSKDYSINPVELVSVAFISLLPLIIFLGSGILNISIIILDLLFLTEIIKKKKIDFLKDKTFYLLILVWIMLILNLVFSSIEPSNSLLRSIGFLRFILFVFALKYFFQINNHVYRDKIFKIWTFFFLIVSIDLAYEYFSGQNIFGWKAELPGRLVGFFEDEMKIGHLYAAFILVSLITIKNFLLNSRIKKNVIFLECIFYIFVIFFLLISLLIGERANFVRVLLILTLFLVFFVKNYKVLFSILLISSILVFSVISNNDRLNHRFYSQFIQPIVEKPLVDNLFMKPYGNHYKVALEIYENNKLFGVGLRNYVHEARKDIYSKNSSVHPHQVHFEFLAELGISGYFFFFYLFFNIIYFGIKSFVLTRDFYQLSGILYIFAMLLPFIPTGSFFNTYGATLFWINFALILQTKKSN